VSHCAIFTSCLASCVGAAWQRRHRISQCPNRPYQSRLHTWRTQFVSVSSIGPHTASNRQFMLKEVSPVNLRDATEIERDVASFAPPGNGGLIVMGGAATTLHRDLIITLAARHKLPAVYFERFFVAAGGLVDRFHETNRIGGWSLNSQTSS
jgi:hypothetical protein